MKQAEGKRVRAVAETVALAHRVLLGVRAVESLLVGLGTVGCLLAASIWSGGNAESMDAGLVALSCGLLAAIAFARSRRATRLDTARRLDACIGTRGAIVTAFDNEAPACSGLASLLESRVAGVLSARAAVRAVLPPSVFPIVVPFAALVLFAAARDSVPAPLPSILSATRDVSDRLIRSGELALDESESGAESTEIDSDLAARFRDLVRAASKLQDAQDGDGADADTLDEITSIERDIQTIRSALPPTEPVVQELREASTLLDALRMRIERNEAIRRGRSAASVQSNAAAGSPFTGTSESRETPPVEVSGGTEGKAPTMVELAAMDTGWWSPEFDSVVADWIQRRGISSSNEGRD